MLIFHCSDHQESLIVKCATSNLPRRVTVIAICRCVVAKDRRNCQTLQHIQELTLERSYINVIFVKKHLENCIIGNMNVHILERSHISVSFVKKSFFLHIFFHKNCTYMVSASSGQCRPSENIILLFLQESYKKEQNCSDHEFLHTGERPYKCKKCGFRFQIFYKYVYFILLVLNFPSYFGVKFEA